MFTIFASITHRTLGDFACSSLLISSIADLFEDSRLHIYFRDDRPYKQPILRCIPNLTGVVTTKPDAMLPLDYFDNNAGRIQIKDPQADASEIRAADMAIFDVSLREPMLNSIPLIRFRPPAEMVESGDQALMSLGLDPTKWIATVYWKEADYKYRGYCPHRSIVDTTPYLQLIRYILKDLGGQVIRLGHPTKTVLPKCQGLVDLAHVENSEWLQLYAVTVSRFMIATGSGPCAYGSAFGVPTALTDHLWCDGAWRDHDYILMRRFEKNGRIYAQQEIFDGGFMEDSYSKEDCEPINNTSAELIATAEEMYNVTTACVGWRDTTSDPPMTQKPNFVRWPIPLRRRTDLLIPPSLRAKPPAGTIPGG